MRGGGLPQWNCGGEQSGRARSGDLAPRSQPSIAVSSDGSRWSVVNASPDIRDQLARFPGLHPRPGTRDVPIDTIVLTSAELDHVMGLLVLREALPYRIVSTPWVRDAILENNSAFGLMEPAWGVVKLDEPFLLDRERQLEAKLFPVPGKTPRYLIDRVSYHAEGTAALRITEQRSGRRLVYAPGVKTLDGGTVAELEAADVRFVDGTFFTADELLAMRPGAPDAFAMGHVPITGPGGSLEVLAGLGGRTLYIHMNNTNPILDPGSEAHRRVRSVGVEIAEDGADLEL